MFTTEQIELANSKIKTGAEFPKYCKARTLFKSIKQMLLKRAYSELHT
jgi:hypothetical protein